MNHKFTRNLGLKIVSLVMAFLIWILVANINNPTRSQLFKGVKVKIINQDSVTDIDKVFDVIDGDTVTLKVTERQKILENLKNSDFEVIADMENLNEMDAVPLYVACSNAAVTWDEIDVYPASIKVQLEQKTQSEFQVSVTTEGQVAKGYEVGSTEILSGKTVQVAGPESLLKKIGKISAVVNVTGVDSEIIKTVTLKVYDKNEEQFLESQMDRIQIKDAAGVLLSENKVKVRVSLWEIMNDIPVAVETTGTPAAGYRITSISTVPVTVNLVGTQEALARLDGKIVLKEPISVEGASESITTDVDLTESLEDVEGIRLVADADPTISVTVQIEKTGDRTVEVPLSSLELKNKPEDMTLTFSPADAVSVRIHSEDESVYSIKVSDIRCSADLSLCVNAGSYEIPVEVELPEGYELVSDVVIIVTSEKEVKENEVNTEG